MTLECPLDCKEIQPVHPKGNQSWIFIGRTDAEAETPILWPPDVNNWLIGKDPDAGKDWRQEKDTTEDEMVGWHHWLDGHEFEQAPGVGDGQAGLAAAVPGVAESDTTEWLNWFHWFLPDIKMNQPYVYPCPHWLLYFRSCAGVVEFTMDRMNFEIHQLSTRTWVEAMKLFYSGPCVIVIEALVPTVRFALKSLHSKTSPRLHFYVSFSDCWCQWSN